MGTEIALALGVRGNLGLGALRITGPYLTTYASTSCSNGTAIPGSQQVYSIPQSVITYLGVNNTVSDLITLSNRALGGTYNAGGNNSPSFQDLANACAAITNAFDHCRIFSGFSSSASRPGEVAIIPDAVRNLTLYPNPTSGNATISFVAGEGSHAVLDIYNVSGSLQAQVMDNLVQADGIYSVEVDCSSYSKGIYFVRLTVDNETTIGKLVIIK